MYAYPITQFGVDRLERVELPMLQIASGMVLIKVHRSLAQLSRPDDGEGILQPEDGASAYPLFGRSGEVVAIGEGVKRVRVGDRVCGIFMQRWLDGPLTGRNRRRRSAEMSMGCSPSVSCWIRMGLSVFRSTLAMKRRRRSPARA